MNPTCNWTVISTCRKDDPDRSGRFFSAIKIYNAKGKMGDLDDGPIQEPLKIEQVEQMILSLLPARNYDLIITHSIEGEYTRHRRHEEVAKAVTTLVETGRLQTDELLIFAYEDGNKKHFPRPIESAETIVQLPDHIWMKKYKIITETYGFDEQSWEAKTTPVKEAFWNFKSAAVTKERGLAK